MIQVQNLVKDFKLTRKIRKEMGEEFKNRKTLRAVDKISFTCQPGRIFAL
jgi:ABC-type oligopeptide transport system ATPase subunit